MTGVREDFIDEGLRAVGDRSARHECIMKDLGKIESRVKLLDDSPSVHGGLTVSEVLDRVNS